MAELGLKVRQSVKEHSVYIFHETDKKLESSHDKTEMDFIQQELCYIGWVWEN